MNLSDWNLSELGEDIWKRKYCYNNETFDEWLDRVCGGNTGKVNEELRELIATKQFLFGGRILASRGITDRHVTYSNCYVLPRVGDSIEAIYGTASDLARTFSYGGGVGIDISNLRPKGSPVNNAARTTSGAVSFMETFSNVSSVIGQEGRRGALMISMDCNHKEVEDFIDSKKNTNKLEGCNISVRVDDDFMEIPFSKKETLTDSEQKKLDLYKKLCYNNWDYAEPGILYWDTINNYNLLSEYIKDGDFEYAGVNPCAEEPLPAGGSCLLGAINLAEFVEDEYSPVRAFDLPKFQKAVKIAVRALNEVLDEGLPLHPLQIQRETVRDWRQIGLGIMGFGDMLIKMGIVYGSTKSLGLIKTIGYGLVSAGLEASAELAKEKGAFPKYDNRILNSSFIKNLVTDTNLLSKIKAYGLRNSQLFTIAPTGSISTMLGVSGGVEPIFDYKYTRTTKSLHGEDKIYTVVTPIVEESLKYHGIDSSNIGDAELPEEIVWAKIINPIDRIKTQGQWQEFIDASISSTVNLPNVCTPEDIEQYYKLAWTVGCKGLTIYRDGCKREGILNTIKEDKEEEKPSIPIESNLNFDIIGEDTSIENCIARGSKINTGCGSLWISIYIHKVTGRICHVFLNKGSTGGCNSFMVGLSRLISLAGRNGASVDEIVDQLNSVVACPSYILRSKTKHDTSAGNCCPTAIGKEIKRLYTEHMNSLYANSTEQPATHAIPTLVDYSVTVAPSSNTKCPECGQVLENTGGCIVCSSCGWSKCD